MSRSAVELCRMEIPLSWSTFPMIPLSWSTLPMFSSSKAATDDGSYDIPPSPTVELPSPNAVASGMFFQQGYLDCAQEALSFLVEKEGMPADGAMVAGLKEHLAWASSQFTPASLASPSAPSSSSIFSFPPLPSTQQLMGVKSIGGSSCVTVSQSEPSTVRFAPYSVTDARYRRSRTAANVTVSAPSVMSLGRVLKDNIISSDDLHGVLRCLHYCEPPAAAPCAQFDQGQTFNVSSLETNNITNRLSSSLNDSGLSELGSVDLTDDVDGQPEGDSVAENEVFDLSLSNFHRDLSQAYLDGNPDSTETEPNDRPIQNFSDRGVAGDNNYEETAARTGSPSSQLSLLESLSSGNHPLVNASGDVTANRIQSLANEILLLLEEDAAAGEEESSEDDSDDESDEEEVDDDDGVGDDVALGLETEP